MTRVRYSVLLPAAALMLSAIVPMLIATRTYLRLKLAAHGAHSVSVGGDRNVLTVPTQELSHLVLQFTPMLAEGPIIAINVPAEAVEIILSLLLGQTPDWVPDSFSHEAWEVLTYPIFALPAWWFVGRGIDAMTGRARMRIPHLVVAVVFSLVFLALALFLAFGMSAEEREIRAQWFLYGFAGWTILSAIPSIAWFRYRRSVPPSVV